MNHASIDALPQPSARLWEVSYTLPHEHQVTVGVHAASENEAIRLAEAALDGGTLWDNSPEMPLLYDDYEESCSGHLEFTAVAVNTWTEPDGFVPRATWDKCTVLLLQKCLAVFNHLPRQRAMVKGEKVCTYQLASEIERLLKPAPATAVAKEA